MNKFSSGLDPFPNFMKIKNIFNPWFHLGSFIDISLLKNFIYTDDGTQNRIMRRKHWCTLFRSRKEKIKKMMQSS